jgi:membrane-bound ClpP family serine protease
MNNLTNRLLLGTVITISLLLGIIVLISSTKQERIIQQVESINEVEFVMVPVIGPIGRNTHTQLDTTASRLDSNDILYIVIDSPGGSVYRMQQMINALLTTEAKVVCEVNNLAASAAANLLLACDDYRLGPNALILYHQVMRISDKGIAERPYHVVVYFDYHLENSLCALSMLNKLGLLDKYARGEDVVLTSGQFLEGVKYACKSELLKMYKE